MRELVGKTVDAVYLSDDETFIKFDTNEGEIVYAAYGDCCSYSWFNDVIGVNQLIGSKVINVGESCLPDATPEGHYGCIAVYGYKITSTGGYTDVIFRNESNGYYGGWLELYTRPLSKVFKILEGDFSA